MAAYLWEFAWSEVLHNIRPDEMKLASYTNPLGVVRWEPAISSVCATLRGLGLGWNANGLRKRLENGDLNRMISMHQPAYIFISELKSDVMSLTRPWELRRALAALGYGYAIFNWSVALSDKGASQTGNWGSAFFFANTPFVNDLWFGR